MRVLKLSAQLKTLSKIKQSFVLLGFFFYALSGCTNINSTVGRNITSTLSLSDPKSSTSGGSFQLSTVNPDLASPGTVYDLVGQNSEFDSYCAGSLGTCMCEYTYPQPGVGTQTTSTKVDYQESNLIRCANGVPSGITSFDVRITVVPASSTTSGGVNTVSYSSNTISVNLSTSGAFSGSTSYIDLTNAQSYVPVQRFQCRKREFIKNPLDNLIIDPLQSADPAVIYPFNYYTTNVSESLLKLQQLGDQSWECSLTANQDRTVQWWANQNVFSSIPCTNSFCNGDGYLIYPQVKLSSLAIPVTNPAATGKRRSSFSLSSSAYGVFQIAVKAAVSPATYVASTYAVIGYAAKPIANANGSSSCPAIPLPAHANWVKLWNFRATDITAPKVVTTSQSAFNSSIACDTVHGLNFFPSCETIPQSGVDLHGQNKSFGFPLSYLSSTSTTPLASRVALLNTTGTTSTSATSACYNIDPAQWNNASYAGKDIWTPSPFRFDNVSVPDATLFSFPFNVYAPLASLTPAPSVTTESGTPTKQWISTNGSQYALPAATPMDYQNQLTSVSLAADNFTDQLYVVTDSEVDDSLMRNASPSVSQYIPSTYRAFQDCPGNNPSACGTTNQLHWGINVKEVGTANGADLYPLCVLQFYD